MCLAIPGKIVKKYGEGDKEFASLMSLPGALRFASCVVVVDYGDRQFEAGIIDGDYSVGDYVIVQGKIVVDKVPLEQVERWKDFLKEEL